MSNFSFRQNLGTYEAYPVLVAGQLYISGTTGTVSASIAGSTVTDGVVTPHGLQAGSGFGMKRTGAGQWSLYLGGVFSGCICNFFQMEQSGSQYSSQNISVVPNGSGLAVSPFKNGTVTVTSSSFAFLSSSGGFADPLAVQGVVVNFLGLFANGGPKS